MQNHSENNGFFKARVTGDTVVKRKRAHAVYTVEAGDQYAINSVVYENDSSQLVRAIQASTDKTLLKKGDPYDLDVIKGERLRIDNHLKENGFYYFTPDYLIVKVDSTNGNHLVDMRVGIKPETPEEARQAYRINNVFIYSGFNLNVAPVYNLSPSGICFVALQATIRKQTLKKYILCQTLSIIAADFD